MTNILVGQLKSWTLPAIEGEEEQQLRINHKIIITHVNLIQFMSICGNLKRFSDEQGKISDFFVSNFIFHDSTTAMQRHVFM